MKLTPKQRNDKLAALCDSEGYSDLLAFLEASVCDSVAAGICLNVDCEYTTEVEPDSRAGYCECCGTSSVQSGLVLAGVI